MQQRVPRVRLRAVPDSSLLVVRGDELDASILRDDAANFHERFIDWWRYGVSAYLARDEDEVAVLCANRLVRFATIAVFQTELLLRAGVDVVPTFRTPHVSLCHNLLDGLVERLQSCEHEERLNPYHEG